MATIRQVRLHNARRVFRCSTSYRPNSNPPEIKCRPVAKTVRNSSSIEAVTVKINECGCRYRARCTALKARKSKAKSRRLMPRMDSNLKKSQERQRLDRSKRNGPLCYCISITLMAMRPLLKTLQNNPEKLSLDLVESVTPLLEQLEASLNSCNGCPILDKSMAKILN